MQAPKNNLQDILRRKIQSDSVVSPVPSSSHLPRTKFKPANFANSNHFAPDATSVLPSFSTPGFGRTRPTHKKTKIAAPTSDVVTISSDSNLSSPPCSIKRTSSDLSVTDHSHLSKRLKRDSLAEKENFFQPINKTQTMGKVNEQIPCTVRVPQLASYGDDKLYMKAGSDVERNSQVKSDHSYTSQPPIAITGLVLPAEDNDLLSKDTETLKTLLLEDHEILGMITGKELEHHRSLTKKADIAMLEKLRLSVNGRIASIKKIITLRESETSLIPSPALQALKLIPKTKSGSEGPSYITTSQEGSSSNTIGHIHQLQGKVDTTFDKGDVPGSEADYWVGMDDVPMDDSHSEDDLLPVDRFSLSSSATPNTSLIANVHYSEIMCKLKDVFGLRTFRPNQLEAIIEALSGRDVFILMPTGGGKSLCYQLPAVCQTGKTQGITVVVSPLLALMKDQVHALEERGVNVFLWNSEAAWDEALHRMRAITKPSLMYITPEKLKESGTAQSILAELYQKNELARFVIDEAHCISTWGQDFREAYRDLDLLRVRYPTVPIMALTATARKLTVADITKRLKLRDDYAFFTQSFNRPNLIYVIEPKTKKWMDSMMEFISSKHPGKSGVIYCLGRDKCEEVAKKLSEHGFSAKHFHARMTQPDKDRTLHEWRKGKVHIIVATIAFGMGIDKADVRFVIHHSLPKSLDGYYQETGRAGRDGKPADCILYFLYKDFITLRSMIERPERDNMVPSAESIDRQTAAARAVVEYCMNISECRRVQLLHYFDEKFDKIKCGRSCDNCAHPDPLVSRTVTKEARNAVDLVQIFQTRADLVTLAQCRDILRGVNNAAIRSKQHDKEPLYGSARDMPPELLEQLLRRLCFTDVLEEKSIQQASGYHTDYVVLGPAARSFQDSREEVEIQWRPKPGKPSIKITRKQPTSKILNESVTKGKQKAAELDPIELYEDDSDDDKRSRLPKTTWPPRRASRSRIAHTDGLVAVSGAAEVEQPTHPIDSDPASNLYQQMCKLREQIMLQDNISAPDEVLDDSTLQYLSVTCPLDYTSFKSSMKVVIQDIMSEDEAVQHVERKFNNYGSKFLSLCLKHKCVSNSPQIAPFNVEGLHSRFGYHDRPTAAATTVAKKSKFKPQR